MDRSFRSADAGAEALRPSGGSGAPVTEGRPESARDDREWLEADGLGGYAMGTVSCVRTRRYHALLCVATRPPVGRFTLVNGVEEEIEAAGERFPLFVEPREGSPPAGPDALVRFEAVPWPRWTYRSGGVEVEREIFVPRDLPAVVLVWRLVRGGPARLLVRPLLSGRDHHLLHRENAALRTGAAEDPGAVTWTPYPGAPAVRARHDGAYRHDPLWRRGYRYAVETDRGLDDTEDLWSPGAFTFDLAPGGSAHLVLSTEPPPDAAAAVATERTRRAAATRAATSPVSGDPMRATLLRAAEAYVVRRGGGRTIVAGYPWFTDWGRDTFIAMRGLLLSAGAHDAAREILVEWAGAVDRGMLPNHFPDETEGAAFNSVDASLWYCVAAAEARDRGALGGADLERVAAAVRAILEGYRAGTRHGIRADEDGLLLAGAPGSQLTWMDVKIGDRVITPRTGKPVEIQALWANALAAWGRAAEAARAADAFRARFWCAERHHLYDVVDGPEGADARLRPNQLLAVALPYPLLPPDRARAVVDACERALLTPLGLRTLDPDDPAYRRRYWGDRVGRDEAYHQGTAWPWLLGPFVEAWVKVRGASPEAKREARRYLAGVEAHLSAFGIGHVAEVADGDFPHVPGGCPFQAWSVGEMIRVLEVLS